MTDQQFARYTQFLRVTEAIKRFYPVCNFLFAAIVFAIRFAVCKKFDCAMGYALGSLMICSIVYVVYSTVINLIRRSKDAAYKAFLLAKTESGMDSILEEKSEKIDGLNDNSKGV